MTSDTARRLAEEKYPWQGHGGSYDRETDLMRTAFLAGWKARGEVTEEVVERAAEAVHARIWPGLNWDDMPEQYRQDIRAQERAALSATLGGDS